jgi:hypothetical protein
MAAESEPQPRQRLPLATPRAWGWLALGVGLFCWCCAGDGKPNGVTFEKYEAALYISFLAGIGAAIGARLAIHSIILRTRNWIGWISLFVNAALVLTVIARLAEWLWPVAKS